jgi:hypothetical protein
MSRSLRNILKVLNKSMSPIIMLYNKRTAQFSHTRCIDGSYFIRVCPQGGGGGLKTDLKPPLLSYKV